MCKSYTHTYMQTHTNTLKSYTKAFGMKNLNSQESEDIRTCSGTEKLVYSKCSHYTKILYIFTAVPSKTSMAFMIELENQS